MADGISFLMMLALWALTGCLAGLLFAMIIGTGKRGGFWGYIMLGIIGAVLSGILFRVLGGPMMVESWQANLMAAVAGALILMVMAEYAQRQQAAKKAQR